MLAAYYENGVANVMNIASVSIADKEHTDAVDFFGIATGNKIFDKFKNTEHKAIKSDKVNIPIIYEFPVCMECELAEIVDTLKRELENVDFVVLEKIRNNMKSL